MTYPNEESKLFGLKTKGEYGLWLSILKLLEKISRESYSNIIHIIEDDFRFNSSIISEFKKIVIEQKYLSEDIIFLDYLIDIPLLNLINLIIKQKKESSKDIQKYFSASYFYLGCTSSFLIRKSCVENLLNILKKIFQNLKSENRLQPIDMVLRSLFRKGILKGSIIIPPFGSPDWIMDDYSSIQTKHISSIKNTMRAYLLFRSAVSGIRDVKFCAKEIANLFKFEINENNIKTLDDFYKFIEKNKNYFNNKW